MRIFQIFGGFCHWDATQKHASIEDTKGKYAPNIIFIEAPDYVREGWGYDGTKEGDERFIQPTPPEGWLYDLETGTFYLEGEVAPSQIPTETERLRADVDYIAIMTGVEL